MESLSYDPEALMRDEARLNRRLTERIPADLCLLYSGIHQGHLVMGDGMMTNLSTEESVSAETDSSLSAWSWRSSSIYRTLRIPFALPRLAFRGSRSVVLGLKC